MPWDNPFTTNTIRHGQGYLGLAQLDMAPGDLKGNAAQIIDAILRAEAEHLDAIVFSEMALMGYPVRDIITRHPHLVDENLKWLQAIAQHTGKTRAIVGFVEPRYTPIGEKATGKPFYNSMAILAEGGIEGLVRKSLLPTYSEFYDSRTFEPSPMAGCQGPYTLASATWEQEAMVADDRDSIDGRPMLIHGRRYGLSICEDTWGDFDFFNRPLYGRDPMVAIARHRPDVLINISASPSRYRKAAMKHDMLSHTAQKYALPLVYVNQVGGVDESVFDGNSCVYNAQGELIAQLPAFEAGVQVVHPEQASPMGKPLQIPVGLQVSRVFQPDDDASLPNLFQTLVTGIRGYFTKCGFERAVLGLSGGLDSALTLAVVAAALGPDNVLAVGMPSDLSSPDSQADAEQLARQAQVVFVQQPIQAAVTNHMTNLQTAMKAIPWVNGSTQIAQENAQAISRATLLRLLGNTYNALPIATSDKSELYLGYATVNGDMTGALAPLGDVVKTKVRALGRWINQHPQLTGLPANVIPDRVLERPPSAELATDPDTGLPIDAEDALMPYLFADEVIWRIETLQQNPTDMMAATFYLEKQQRISKDQKRLWLERFYQRMSSAVFKWWVAPPIIICDSNGSIAKSDYQHLITANRVPWWPQSLEDIQADCEQMARLSQVVSAQTEADVMV
jgi:NAD+ synthase (glutamine-hydrolysing)